MSPGRYRDLERGVDDLGVERERARSETALAPQRFERTNADSAAIDIFDDGFGFYRLGCRRDFDRFCGRFFFGFGGRFFGFGCCRGCVSGRPRLRFRLAGHSSRPLHQGAEAPGDVAAGQFFTLRKRAAQGPRRRYSKASTVAVGWLIFGRR